VVLEGGGKLTEACTPRALKRLKNALTSNISLQTTVQKTKGMEPGNDSIPPSSAYYIATRQPKNMQLYLPSPKLHRPHGVVIAILAIAGPAAVQQQPRQHQRAIQLDREDQACIAIAE
jgi:hypothetical protein